MFDATHDFASLSDSTQQVRDSSYRTDDIPDLCKVRVGCPIGRPDHSHIGIVLDLSLGAPD